ncbi:MAG TPA: glycosyltransferase family 4 protein [Roseomonas sp.]|jgi:glycosyltransferase involved in cell wall biosynthesis
MHRLRVLHASPTWFAPDSVVGGGERWVDNVMQALSVGAPGIEQAMVAIGARAREARRGGVPVRILANERASQVPMDAISAQLWQVFEDHDVIHVHQALTDFGAYACCVATTLRKTVIATDLGGGANPVMMHGGLRLVDGVLSLSRYAQSLLPPMPPTATLIATGPVDTERFSPGGPRAAAPAAICVSRIMPHKGIDRIIRALPPGLRLRIVGRVYHEPYRALLGELAAGKDVEFIHDADDDRLIALYRQSSLFLQASCFLDIYGSLAPKTELMGLTTLEAMACGLPIAVSADGGSLPELVTDAAFGRVFTNQAELEALLRQHQAGLWPGGDAGDAARRHVVAACGLAAYGRRLADFYQGVHAQYRVGGLACAS